MYGKPNLPARPGDGNHAPAVTRITDMVSSGRYSPDVLSTTTQPLSLLASSSPLDGPGSSVGHYVIVSRLGGGAQGVVYKAKDSKLKRLVALKFLFPHLCDDDWARERFIREAQAGSAVEHPNVCAIHSVETTPEGHTFIVMSYYEGLTLKQTLRQSRISVDDAVDIAAQIAEGLAAAHAHGVVHRDIKPGNLMMTDYGVRILDFGLASLADSTQLTLAGSLLGTPAYMSPEQTRGEEVDARSDVWAAGAVLYEMLAGRAPFRGAYPDAVCYGIRWEAPPALTTCGCEVPVELERVVMRALSKDRSERFQSAHEMAVALRRLQGRRTTRIGTSLPRTSLSRRLTRTHPWRTLWTAVGPTYPALLTAASSAALVIRTTTRASAWSERPRV